jgi:hypothetical protein
LPSWQEKKEFNRTAQRCGEDKGVPLAGVQVRPRAGVMASGGVRAGGLCVWCGGPACDAMRAPRAPIDNYICRSAYY